MVGADDSAMPHKLQGVAQDPQTGTYARDTSVTNNANVIQGSNQAGTIYTNDAGRTTAQKQYGLEAAVAFIAIVAFAVYYRR